MTKRYLIDREDKPESFRTGYATAIAKWIGPGRASDRLFAGAAARQAATVIDEWDRGHLAACVALAAGVSLLPVSS